MSGKIVLSREGYDKLYEELQYLKSTKRKEVTEALQVARAHGDLKENAEYDAAKDAKAHLETRIAQLEDKLSRAQILDVSQVPKDKVFLGATVEVENLKIKEKFSYRLVAEDEADFEEGKIAVTSPIGKGLLGLSVNEEANIKVPAGIIKMKILNIKYS